jgi:hypothetical protein
MKNGSTISAGVVGTALSIRLNVATVVGSVEFDLDGNKHTENAAPYTLCGDDGAGNITNCAITSGAHTLTATPFSETALGGVAGAPVTIAFTLAP